MAILGQITPARISCGIIRKILFFLVIWPGKVLLSGFPAQKVGPRVRKVPKKFQFFFRKTQVYTWSGLVNYRWGARLAIFLAKRAGTWPYAALLRPFEVRIVPT